MRLLRSLIVLLILAGISSIVVADDAPTPQDLCDAAEPGELSRMQFEKAQRVLAADVDYRAIFCTSAGAIYVDLYDKLTPFTVNNFVFLAGQGYYDGTTFHRVIPNFMAQGGDPTGTGRGGPGYQFKDEPIGYLTFDRPGLLAMANAGPGTNGSQFFITTAPTPHLNYKHTIFGDVLVGQENVIAIRERDPGTAAEPGEILQTVLIITDPSAVDNRDVVLLEPASQDEVVAVFEAFAAGLPENLAVSADSGLLRTGDLAAGIPSNLQAAFAEYAENYGHQYRYRLNLINDECAENVFFTSLGYQVDVFESENAASDALYDGFNRDLYYGMGFEDTGRIVTFTKQAPTCDHQGGIHMVTLYAHGRFMVAIDLLVELERLGGMPGPRDLLQSLGMQIESSLGAIYRPEIR